MGKREIIAEDLGYMSETVRQLVRDSGFPGMKVLEFAFDSRDTGSASDYLPHNYPVNSVAYTGTHDNETLVSWYQTVTDAERAMVRDYLYDYATPEEQLYKSRIALALAAEKDPADKEASKGDLPADHPLRPKKLGVTV